LLSEIPASELARLCFISPGVSKLSLGKFFATAEPRPTDTLQAFIKLFDFSELTFDQSIRVFLSSFRIGGESQTIGRTIGYFADAYYESHPDSLFPDAVAVHVFAYTWVMLHTLLHNPNVIDKPTLSGFSQLVKNGELDLDKQFLAATFASVKRSPVFTDEDIPGTDPACWELLAQRQRILGRIERASNSEISVFRELWRNFTMCIREANPIVLETLEKCAAISAHHDLHDILDKLFVDLCRFSSNRDTRTLSNVIERHGGKVREGWKWFVELLLEFFRLDILPEEMRTHPSCVITPQMWKKPQRTSFIFRIFGAVSQTELQLVIEDCRFGQVFEQSRSFSDESLDFFVRSLLLTQSQECKIETPESVLCLTWIARTVVVNAHRIEPHWADICERFSAVLTTPHVPLPYLRLVVASVFFLLDETFHEEELRFGLLGLFDGIAAVDQNLIREILSGIDHFFSRHLQSFVLCYRFDAFLSILNSAYPDSVDSNSLLCRLVSAVNANFASAPAGRELYLPLIETTSSYYIMDPNPDYLGRFKDLKHLVMFSLSRDQNVDIFDRALFPALAKLSSEIAVQRREFPNVIERALLFVKVVLSALQSSDFSSFEYLWKKIVESCSSLVSLGEPDMNESIPELLFGALNGMKGLGVFEGDASQKLLADSWAIIQSLSPSSG
jgi:hypothetical protein